MKSTVDGLTKTAQGCPLIFFWRKLCSTKNQTKLWFWNFVPIDWNSTHTTRAQILMQSYGKMAHTIRKFRQNCTRLSFELFFVVDCASQKIENIDFLNFRWKNCPLHFTRTSWDAAARKFQTVRHRSEIFAQIGLHHKKLQTKWLRVSFQNFWNRPLCSTKFAKNRFFDFYDRVQYSLHLLRYSQENLAEPNWKATTLIPTGRNPSRNNTYIGHVCGLFAVPRARKNKRNTANELDKNNPDLDFAVWWRA